MATKRLILVTAYNPHDVSKWSGTLYFLFDALVRDAGNIKVEYIRGALGIFDFVARAINKILRYFGISLDSRFSTAYAVIIGSYLSVRLLFAKSGTLLGIATSNELSYVKTNRDIIYVSDGTFRAVSALYPSFQKFPRWLQKQGDENEKRTLSKARYIIHSSRWANKSAKLDYGVPNDRLIEIPFGPNIGDDWIDRYYLPKSISLNEPIKLMFVSADWERKNGDKAVEIAKSLNDGGHDARLTIIGDAPSYVTKFGFVDSMGFLRKSDPDQLAKLCQAYCDAHFFLLPTVADTFAVVFSEAQAFGLPSITYDIGGTGSAVLDGQTGLLFRIGTPTNKFAEEILRYAKRPELYNELSMNCRKRYRESANWGNWSRVILSHL